MEGGIGVGLLSDDGSVEEVLRDGRRGCLPLKAVGSPGVGGGDGAGVEGPEKIDGNHDVSEAHDGGSGGGHDIQDLPLRRVGGVAAGHAEVAEDELRAEGEEEVDSTVTSAAILAGNFGVHAACEFGPPEVTSPPR